MKSVPLGTRMANSGWIRDEVNNNKGWKLYERKLLGVKLVFALILMQKLVWSPNRCLLHLWLHEGVERYKPEPSLSSLQVFPFIFPNAMQVGTKPFWGLLECEKSCNELFKLFSNCLSISFLQKKFKLFKLSSTMVFKLFASF